MNQRVIDVGLVSALESVKKDVKALKVGFQQSSIGTTLASAIFIAKQMGRCKTRTISIVAKLQDASKMQHNDTIVGRTDRADVEDGRPLELAVLSVLDSDEFCTTSMSRLVMAPFFWRFTVACDVPK